MSEQAPAWSIQLRRCRSASSDRLIEGELLLFPHKIASASAEPPHTATSPRMRLLDRVEGGKQKGAASNRGKSLPLVRRKRAVSTHKSNWDQESPCRIQTGPLVQISQREADNHACGDIDDQGAVGKLGPQPARNHRANRISGNGAQRPAQRNVEIFLQIECSSLSMF